MSSRGWAGRRREERVAVGEAERRKEARICRSRRCGSGWMEAARRRLGSWCRCPLLFPSLSSLSLPLSL
uniref:Uncharacterized protein n=1 Tax=Arundo donax TaxID=35708 RepID=A0A0A9G7W1_ARUDO